MTRLLHLSSALLVLSVAFLAARPLPAADCNGNGVEDAEDLVGRASEDCNSDGIPDECQNGFVALGGKGDGLRLEGTGRKTVATDLDGDGLADLAAITQTDVQTSGVSIFRNRSAEATAASTFEETAQIRVGRNLDALAHGDLDGDGATDLVVAESSSTSELTVLWNDGDGGFPALSTLTVHGIVSDLVIADLDRDGRADIAASLRSHDSVAIFSGRDGRRFSDPAIHAVGDQPVALVSADLDGDARLDLAIANNRSRDISILAGAPNGEFVPRGTLPLEAAPLDLQDADFDGDGKRDLVASSAAGVLFLLNEGGSNFGLSIFDRAAKFVRVADVEGDGDPDVIINDSSLPTSLPVLLNDGDGRFRSSAMVGVPSTARDAWPADLDGDGDLDLAVITASPESITLLWNGEGASIPVETRAFRLRDGRPPHALTLADLDGDGDLDLATGDGLQLSVTIMTNDGRGSFSTKSNRSRGAYINSIASADFDHDGDFDLVFAALKSHHLVVMKNSGDADFPDEATRTYGSGHNPFMVTTGDLDGDTFADIVSANQGDHTVTVLKNDGAGGFPGRRDYVDVGTAPEAVTIADLDGDGHRDLAVASGTDGQVAILVNQGDGSFRPATPLNALGDSVFVIAGDWNGDGHADLATANQAQGAVAIFMNRGGGNFDEARLQPLGQIPYSLTTADFNGDGNNDLVTANQLSNSVSVLLNRGDGSFFALAHFPTGIDPRVAGAGDLDGDGDADLVSANHTAEEITVLINGSRPISRASHAERLCTLEDFAALSIPSGEHGFSTKYIVPARGGDGDDRLPTLFQNTNRNALHHEFLRNTFPDRFPSLSAAELRNLTEIRNTREYFVGALEFAAIPGRGLATVFTIVTSQLRSEALAQSEVEWVHAKLSEAFTPTPLLYAPDPTGDNPVARERAASWNDPPFEIHLGTLRDADYEAYTTGVGYGRVRLLSLDEFREANRSGRFTLQDIPVIGAAPTDIEGVVGAVVTASIQPVTSHVAIRTARRRTPNAYIAGALEVFAPHDGALIRLEVRADGYRIDPATEEEAAEHWDRIRPALPAVPDFDPDYRELDSFEEMDLASSPEARYGGKASNLARLQTILNGPFEPYRERGFAIPMAHYFDFLDNNRMLSPRVPGKLVTYREHLEELQGLRQFQNDSAFRFEALQQFRDYAKRAAVIPPELVERLARRIEEVFGTREIMVRFRSSSNVEDLLEFNGAGLYESTSVCAADSFDEDDEGASLCNGDKERERTIEEALIQVWTSLWTFRAHEERSFFRIPQEQAAMGILVNRAFPDERVNGVAFTGDPTQPRGNCYVVTAQIDEISVVHPDPGVLPERNVLEMVDGRVVRILRAQRSTMVGADEVVMTDAELEELGAFMWQSDREFPIDTEDHPREDVLLDFEFKIEADDSLAVKQIRPFLTAGQPSSLPVFEFEIPQGAAACGGLNIAAPSRSIRSEYEAKSILRFRPGVFDLPSRLCVFAAELIEEIEIGAEGEVARPEGPGLFRVDSAPDFATQGTRHTFRYEQIFRLDGGRSLEIRLSGLSFLEKDGLAIPARLVLDETFITFRLKMLGFLDEPPTTVAYGSCDNRLLPLWDVRAELADGTSLFLEERFLPEENVNLTGRASVEAAEVFLAGSSRLLRDYWKLVYSSSRHNTYVNYWTVLDPPVPLAGVGAVHVVQLEAPDDPDLLQDPQPAGAAYLDADFNVLARVEVLGFTKGPALPSASPRFLRGDASGDGQIDLSDSIRLLYHLYLGERAPSCHDAADANDDGILDTSDPIQLLAHLFLGDSMPPPVGICAEDSSADELDCEEYNHCL